MSSYTDLEVGLYHSGPGAYSVELRLSSGTEADRRWTRPIIVNLDLNALRQAAVGADMEEYGRLLGQGLFESTSLKQAFVHARAIADENKVPLRVRLFIEHGATDLHTLLWETLRDPESGVPLLTDEHILFSRYLSSWDWRPVRAKARSQLRALVVVANPKNLASWTASDGRSLAPVDVEGELKRIRASLHELSVETLASGGRATLDELISNLHKGHDVLYLVCHGTMARGEPSLLLENESGEVARVKGSELIQRMNELETRPRLVVLASCQSAGEGGGACAADASSLAALGPGLAEAGVPSVLAMQGSISMTTVARFMPVFFTELQRDGQIDRAMTAARGAVRDQPDWWMPVLFMRLKSGRLWYVPGFGGDPKGFQKWPALLEFIRDRKCTPVLGMGLVEPLLGSLRDIAQSWAERFHFPMAPYESEDLALVTQFLAINQARNFPVSRLGHHIREGLRRRYRADLADVEQDAPLDELISRAGVLLRRSSSAEPHSVLAQLPCPIYLTTNFDNLLADALREAGKSPRVEFCRWKEELVDAAPSLAEEEPRYRPDPKNPLVYHLFGRFEVPESLVLTQDDHLDFLIGYTRNHDLVPQAVRKALSMSALLFIGFQLDALGFRVLFRSIFSQEGNRRLRDYSHVAAQVDPEAGRILEPDGARQYLESYFRESAAVSLYWGDTCDFLEELQSQWRSMT